MAGQGGGEYTDHHDGCADAPALWYSVGGATDLAITANDDGSYTYASTDAVYQSALRFFNVFPITLKAGVSYTLSIDKELDVDIRIAGGGRIVAGKTSVTFTPSADTLVDHVAIDRPTGHSGTNTVKVMLCEGNYCKAVGAVHRRTGRALSGLPTGTIADSLARRGLTMFPAAMGGYWKVSLDADHGRRAGVCRCCGDRRLHGAISGLVRRTGCHRAWTEAETWIDWREAIWRMALTGIITDATKLSRRCSR